MGPGSQGSGQYGTGGRMGTGGTSRNPAEEGGEMSPGTSEEPSNPSNPGGDPDD